MVGLAFESFVYIASIQFVDQLAQYISSTGVGLPTTFNARYSWMKLQRSLTFLYDRSLKLVQAYQVEVVPVDTCSDIASSRHAFNSFEKE